MIRSARPDWCLTGTLHLGPSWSSWTLTFFVGAARHSCFELWKVWITNFDVSHFDFEECVDYTLKMIEMCLMCAFSLFGVSTHSIECIKPEIIYALHCISHVVQRVCFVHFMFELPKNKHRKVKIKIFKYFSVCLLSSPIRVRERYFCIHIKF